MKENSASAEKISQYQSAVCTFAYYLALISLIGERVESGSLTDKTALTDALEWAEKYKLKFLASRKALGLSVDEKSAMVAFEEDFFFNGFRIIGGRFEGDKGCVDAIAGKWDLGKSIPTEDEAVRYEVGVFCLMLAGGSQAVFTALKEDEEECVMEQIPHENKKSKKTGFFTKIKSFFSGRNEPPKIRKVWDSAWVEEEDEYVA